MRLFKGEMIVAAVLAAGVAGTALGQFTGSSGGPGAKGTINVTPPKPAKADDPPVLMTYASVLLIAAAVVGANMIPSKRGHQD